MDPGVPLVSILIVTWNRSGELRRCLESAFAQSYGNIEVIVIDNDSDDETAGMVRSEFPGTLLLRSHVNLGCPSGRNLGFANCQGRYIYSLDDDGWLDRDAVAAAVSRVEADASIAVAMSQIHEMQDGRVVSKRPDDDCPMYLGTFSGGCSLLRRAALEQVGYFPDDFFRQAEEENLSLRLLQAGYLTVFEPRSIMYHAPSPVGRCGTQFLYYALRNTTKTALRLWPFPWCAARLLAVVGNALRAAVVRRAVWIPFMLFGSFVRDVWMLPKTRRPVDRPTFRMFRSLRKSPSSSRPVFPHTAAAPTR